MSITELESKFAKLVYEHASQHDTVTVTYACEELGLKRMNVLVVVDNLIQRGFLEKIEHSEQNRYRAC